MTTPNDVIRMDDGSTMRPTLVTDPRAEMVKCDCYETFNWYKGRDMKHHDGCAQVIRQAELATNDAHRKTLGGFFSKIR